MQSTLQNNSFTSAVRRNWDTIKSKKVGSRFFGKKLRLNRETMNIRVIASFLGVLCLIPAFQGPNNEVTSQVALCMYTFAFSCFASVCIIRPQLFWTKQLILLSTNIICYLAD